MKVLITLIIWMTLRDIAYQNLEIKGMLFFYFSHHCTYLFQENCNNLHYLFWAINYVSSVLYTFMLFAPYLILFTTRRLINTVFCMWKTGCILSLQIPLKVYFVQEVRLEGSPFAQCSWLYPPFLLGLRTFMTT